MVVNHCFCAGRCTGACTWSSIYLSISLGYCYTTLHCIWCWHKWLCLSKQLSAALLLFLVASLWGQMGRCYNPRKPSVQRHRAEGVDSGRWSGVDRRRLEKVDGDMCCPGGGHDDLGWLLMVRGRRLSPPAHSNCALQHRFGDLLLCCLEGPD